MNEPDNITTMNTSFLFVAVTILCLRASAAFVATNGENARVPVENAPTGATTVLGMIGGRGWDNNDYLSGLSGDEEDRKKSQDDYKDFSERRAAFNARQEEIMKTPQGQAFMKQMQEQQFRNLQRDELASEEDGPMFEEFEEGSGGGTRMAQMMAQAKRMQGRQRGMGMIGGFNQQLLGPLEDDEDEEKN